MARLGLWGPVAFWMAVIFTASSRSDVGRLGRIPDWITHGIVYMLLALLLCRALAGGWGRGLRPLLAAAAVLAASAYGVSDEYHQSFIPRRDASAGDVVKDLGGALVGTLAYRRRFGGG